MLSHAALTQATAVTASWLADLRAGAGDWALVSTSGMPAVTAARSAYGLRCERLADPQVKFVPGQPSSHERGLEHIDHLLAIGM